MGASSPTVLEPLRPGATLVRAAGGLVLRAGEDERYEVAVVHRPGREDWTFPKGKLEPGETLAECAVREVLEETGLVCRLGSIAGHVEYRDRKDRPKTVTYWTMQVEGGSFAPTDEVDELRWLTLEEAVRRLTYDRDRQLLTHLSHELVI